MGMELFPLASIRDPVAVTDKNGMFNNIALFTVVDDPKSKHSPSDMHIFQVIDQSVMVILIVIRTLFVDLKLRRWLCLPYYVNNCLYCLNLYS